MSKQCGTQTVDVLLEFPSFVASIKLLGRVSGCSSKRGQYKWYHPHHSSAVSFPEHVILVEYSPVPCCLIIWLICIDPTSKEFDEHVRVV